MKYSKLIARRVVFLIPVILLVSAIVFSLLFLIPGNPALTLLGENATPEAIAELEIELGLDQPIYLQYWGWLSKALKGDLGRSLFTGQLVSEAVISRLGVTISVVVASMIIAVSIGLIFGITAVLKPNGVIDFISRLFATTGVAVPNFWLGMLLVLLFSIQLGWLPPSGYASLTQGLGKYLSYLILPSTAIGAAGAAQVTRHLRSSLLEELGSDYVRTAYSKGLKRNRVIIVHAFQNALLPVISTIGTLFSTLIGATVIIETLFAIPGMGQLAVNSILQRDFPMLQGVILVLALIVLAISLVTDIIYGIIDPRIDY